MKEDIMCPYNEITIKGGGTLIMNGDFRIVCIGSNCKDYETCERKPEV